MYLVFKLTQVYLYLGYMHSVYKPTSVLWMQKCVDFLCTDCTDLFFMYKDYINPIFKHM